MSRLFMIFFRKYLDIYELYSYNGIKGEEVMNVFKKLRTDKGITQVELAQIMNVQQTTVSKWEVGKATPDYPVLLKLSEYYGVSLEYLLGREEKSPPENQESNSRGLYIPEKYRDVMVAFSGGADDLTQEDIDSIVKFIEFTKNNKKK